MVCKRTCVWMKYHIQQRECVCVKTLFWRERRWASNSAALAAAGHAMLPSYFNNTQRGTKRDGFQNGKFWGLTKLETLVHQQFWYKFGWFSGIQKGIKTDGFQNGKFWGFSKLAIWYTSNEGTRLGVSKLLVCSNDNKCAITKTGKRSVREILVALPSRHGHLALLSQVGCEACQCMRKGISGLSSWPFHVAIIGTVTACFHSRLSCCGGYIAQTHTHRVSKDAGVILSCSLYIHSLLCVQIGNVLAEGRLLGWLCVEFVLLLQLL